MAGQAWTEQLHSNTDTRFVVTRHQERLVVHHMAQSGHHCKYLLINRTNCLRKCWCPV